MIDSDTCKPNKVWTKYLTETRKIWDEGKEFRRQKGLKNVEVMDVYEDGVHVKSIIVDKKTNDILDEISPSYFLACHQMDFIRLQNELNEIESHIKESTFKRLFKPVRYFMK